MENTIEKISIIVNPIFKTQLHDILSSNALYLKYEMITDFETTYFFSSLTQENIKKIEENLCELEFPFILIYKKITKESIFTLIRKSEMLYLKNTFSLED